MDGDDTFLYQGGSVSGEMTTNVVVQEGIQRIDDEAFKNCDALVSVSIPDSVTYIGSCAFQGCENLKRIAIPDGVKKIEKGTFMDCGSLESIVLPNSITSIGEDAFKRCTLLRNIAIPKGVKEIGNEAFSESGIEAFVVPNGVKVIPWYAFSDCLELKTIAIPEGVEKIETGTFAYCTALESIELPNSITLIGEQAFRRCESLKSIAIPKGVKEFGKRAFMESGLEEFVVPNGIKVVPRHAFESCWMLQTLELPSSVEKIGREAFRCCDNLENFVLPNGLPKLTRLNFYESLLDVNGFDLIRQLIVNAPNLEELSLNSSCWKRTAESGSKILNDDDMPMVLQWVSLSPSLRTLTVSLNDFTPKVFERLASQNIPGHLRCLEMFPSQYDSKLSAPETHLLRVLEANPKLGIWLRQFWPSSEHQNVRHQLEMNRYGCRGFTIPDPLWPLLIESIAVLEKEKELFQYETRAIMEIETGAPNLIYQLLRRHSELFVRRRER